MFFKLLRLGQILAHLVAVRRETPMQPSMAKQARINEDGSGTLPAPTAPPPAPAVLPNVDLQNA